ncbi:MAG TPA: hypothetical protein DC049_03330 [Spirochaetia bacterium]|nr:hypothetical protein [Spirochaetia bacterium]
MENNSLQKIPALKINDYPDVLNRAILSTFVFSNDFMLEYFRRAARCKYNEIVIFPKANIELIKNPGIWLTNRSQNSIKELAAAAKKFNMELIPEVNCLAGFNFSPVEEGASIEKNIEHLLEPPAGTVPNWLKEGRKNKRIKRTFKMENEQVYKLIFSVLDEVIELFDNPGRIHLGLDEAWDLGSSGYSKSNDVLYADHISRLADYCRKKKVIMCMWGDHLFAPVQFLDEKGNLLEYNLHGGSPWNTAGAIDLIPKDIQIWSWHYRGYEKFPMLKILKDKGFSVYGVSWINSTNIVNIAKEVKNYQLDGYVSTLWSLHVPREINNPKSWKKQEYEVIPYGAEAAWNTDNASENICRYDGWKIMKDFLWQYVPEDKREIK